MKQCNHRYIAVLFAVIVLLLSVIPRYQAFAADVAAELELSESQDPLSGVLYVNFAVRFDQPVTAAGDVSVEGGVYMGITAPDCIVRNRRFVYRAGGYAAEGVIQIGVTEITDITVTVSGYASSLYEHSGTPFSDSITIHSDYLSLFVPQEHTEAPADTMTEAPYLTLPAASAPDPEQPARDAAVEAKIRAEIASQAAEAEGRNQARAAQYRAQDEAKLAAAEAERKAREKAAGVFPHDEITQPAPVSAGDDAAYEIAATEEDMDAAFEVQISDMDYGVSAPDAPDRIGTVPVTVRQPQAPVDGAPAVQAGLQEAAVPKENEAYAAALSEDLPEKAPVEIIREAPDHADVPAETKLTSADLILIAGVFLAVFTFLFSSVKAAAVLLKK